MNTTNETAPVQPIKLLSVKTMTVADIRKALASGWEDFKKRPMLSAAFGAIFALGGLFILLALLYFERIWLIIPVAVGFPLIGPFVAAGLYEMSRRYQKDEPFTAGEIFGVIVTQRKRELGWMAFVVLFVFWIWIYQVRLLLAIFLQSMSFSSFDAFLNVLATQSGILFLGVGSLIGAAIATVLFSVTVISMPLLLDREIDFISAMIFSVKVVLANPWVMLAWGLMIAAAVLGAMVPAFLGLIIALPVLGHATWHVYRAAVDHLNG